MNNTRRTWMIAYAGWMLAGMGGLCANAAGVEDRWVTSLVDARRAEAGVGKANPAETLAESLWRDCPLACDWFLQDNRVNRGWGKASGWDARGDFAAYLEPGRDNRLERQLVGSVAAELRVAVTVDYPAGDRRWLDLYLDLCHKRRQARLAPLLARTRTLVYATHQNMGTFVYLNTQTQSCPKGSQLRRLDLAPEAQGLPARDELLFDSQNGIVRDPEVSFDGQRLLFAWRKVNDGNLIQAALAPATGNYKIYEMELATRQIRQLTRDDTYGADFEPCYLPNGDILFSSDRCVQELTCGGGDCVNLYLMDKDGKFARRVGFDQTQTGFQHLLEDGRVIFTRRDYNDRAQTYSHALFTMNPDGTGQAEYYGNNTFEPTSFQHSRGIPGTGKVLSIAGGYHSDQGGKLVVIDIRKGRQDYQGLSFINWDPKQAITRGDRYGREGEQYAYPYPIDDKGFLVGLDPIGGYRWKARGDSAEGPRLSYNLYYMTLEGRRELLASHPVLNCAQAAPVMTRPRPVVRATTVDYRQKTGIFYIQNVYLGTSAKGIAPGSIKRLRVNELYYKPTTIGGAVFGPLGPYGPGQRYGGPGLHSITPVGVGSASFDAKGIVGEVDVNPDGSVMFEAPARTPLYFQLIDEKGHVAQSMRSWTTLMPAEKASCVGCHEENDQTPESGQSVTEASRRPPARLKPFASVSGQPFSYAKMVQPIWNQHCVRCHAPGKPAAKIDLTETVVRDIPGERRFNSTRRKFYQSYLTLLKVVRERGGRLTGGQPNEWVDYWTRLFTVELTPPYAAGSARSKLITLLKSGHGKTKLSRDEIDTVSAWIDLNVPFIGEYDELNDWDETALALYRRKMEVRRANEAIEKRNIEEFIAAGK